MSHEELLELLEDIGRHRSELTNLEIKKAERKLPRRIHETLSAFSNSSGGVLLFGVDEEQGFALTGVGDAQKLMADLSAIASDDMEPVLRPEMSVHVVDGATLVVAEVPELPPLEKPCFFKPAGLANGAFIRVGNTNRRMTSYEVFSFMSAREQPRFDGEIVPEATVEDLDMDRLEAYLGELRRTRPGAPFLQGDQTTVLRNLRVVRLDGDFVRPTLAGLLAFGRYPQMFEPQLVITFVQFYGTTEGEPAPNGARFLNNQRFEGPLPLVLENAEATIVASMRKAGLVEGLYRRDIPEYPVQAVREALVNAVVHRDYSTQVRGSHVEVKMFADRLEIQSPGGLFGNVTEDTLEETESTRNLYLMRFLEDLHIAENRGTGVDTMLEEMRRANLAPPQFLDRRTFFRVVLKNHTLLDRETVEWLNQYSQLPLNDGQRLALAYLRINGRIDNGTFRRLNRVPASEATREFRGLVDLGLIEMIGLGRGTYYVLAGTPEDVEEVVVDGKGGVANIERALDDLEEEILALLRVQESIARVDVIERFGLRDRRASYLLDRMKRQGKLMMVGSRRTARYVLPQDATEQP